jgi:hypothetical protein
MSFVSNSLSSSSLSNNSNKMNLHKESFLLYGSNATVNPDYNICSNERFNESSLSNITKVSSKSKRANQTSAKTSFLFSNEIKNNNNNYNDSLSDVLSIDKQTPYHLGNELEINNASIDELLHIPDMLTSTKNNLNNETNNSDEQNTLENHHSNRIAFFKNKINNLNNQILTGSGTFKTNSTMTQQQKAALRSRIPTPTQSQFKSINQRLNESLNNELIEINFAEVRLSEENSQESKSTQKTSIAKKPPVMNLKEESFELMKTPQPDLIDADLLNGSSFRKNINQDLGKKKNLGGAFKIYSTGINETLNENSSLSMVSNKDLQSKIQPINNRVSPFFSLDRTENSPDNNIPRVEPTKRSNTEKIQPVTTPSSTSKPTRNPVRKYRSGSTTSQIVTKVAEKPRIDVRSDMSRPSIMNDITYSLDSDESIAVDDLLNDPEKLKQKLKQSKMNKDQLLQLQEDYMKLLEQYAEAENFIDAFRLTGQMTNASITPNYKMFQVRKFFFSN